MGRKKDIMDKFTKGEWTVPLYTRRDGDNRCWVMRGKTSICRCFGKPKTAEANAHLIASAPTLKQQRDDLLVLCKEFMEIADDGSARFDDPEPGSIYLRAEATIAKCEA